jgi:hypothetical protein
MTTQLTEGSPTVGPYQLTGPVVSLRDYAEVKRLMAILQRWIATLEPPVHMRVFDSEEMVSAGLVMALLEDDYEGVPQMHCQVLYELLGLVADELVQVHSMDPAALRQIIK